MRGIGGEGLNISKMTGGTSKVKEKVSVGGKLPRRNSGAKSSLRCFSGHRLCCIRKDPCMGT